MSDYIPHPDTEMHINEIPEECLRALFSQLPVETQFEAGNVCQLWRTVRDALFRTQKSLVVEIDKYGYRYESGGLIIGGLNEERTAFLVAMFPSLTELTIFISNEALFEESSQVAHLLVQYCHQLVTLKFNSEGNFNPVSPSKRSATGAVLFSAINCMSKLKQLSLDFDMSSRTLLDLDCSFTRGFTALYLPPFDLPILRQLHTLDLNCSIDGRSTVLKLWAPHLEARSTPMEISFTGSLDDASFDSITPKVASMFTKFPELWCNLQQFQHLSTRYTNLTQLSLSDFDTPNQHYASDVPALMRALVNLKQLTTLSIQAQYVAPLNAQPGDDDHLPQLPTVKKWYLQLHPLWASYSHAHLSPWTANLSRFFPALEYLTIVIQTVANCADYGFTAPQTIYYSNNAFSANHQSADVNVPAKAFLRHQLGLIKQQQCPKLSQACICFNIGNDTVSCSLDDLAD